MVNKGLMGEKTAPKKNFWRIESFQIANLSIHHVEAKFQVVIYKPRAPKTWQSPRKAKGLYNY